MIQTQKIAVLFVSVCLTSALLGGAVVGSFLYKKDGDSASGGSQGGPPRTAPAALVRTVEAAWQELGTVRTLHGRLVQVRGGTISSEVSGTVQALPVEVGTPVVGGETEIAKIDDTWTKLALERADNEINALNVKLNFETIELRRITPLVRNLTVSESEFLAQQARVDDLNASLLLVQVAKKEAEEKLKRTTIYAPFNGHIVSKTAEIGDLLAPGNPIVGTISSGQVDAVINVGESIIERIQLGDPITIIVDQLHSRATGTVHAIVPYAPTGARYFPVYLRMDDQNGRFKVGMSVTAIIPTEDPKPGIVVPRDAVLDKPDGQTVWVVVERDNPSGGAQGESAGPTTIVIPVPVKITAHAIDLLMVQPETEEGKTLLTPKTPVVVEGLERLMPNQAVRIVPTDPAWFENLPPGSGHTVIEPKKRIMDQDKFH